MSYFVRVIEYFSQTDKSLLIHNIFTKMRYKLNVDVYISKL